MSKPRVKISKRLVYIFGAGGQFSEESLAISDLTSVGKSESHIHAS